MAIRQSLRYGVYKLSQVEGMRQVSYWAYHGSAVAAISTLSQVPEVTWVTWRGGPTEKCRPGISDIDLTVHLEALPIATTLRKLRRSYRALKSWMPHLGEVFVSDSDRWSLVRQSPPAWALAHQSYRSWTGVRWKDHRERFPLEPQEQSCLGYAIQHYSATKQILDGEQQSAWNLRYREIQAGKVASKGLALLGEKGIEGTAQRKFLALKELIEEKLANSKPRFTYPRLFDLPSSMNAFLLQGWSLGRSWQYLLKHPEALKHAHPAAIRERLVTSISILPGMFVIDDVNFPLEASLFSRLSKAAGVEVGNRSNLWQRVSYATQTLKNTSAVMSKD